MVNGPLAPDETLAPVLESDSTERYLLITSNFPPVVGGSATVYRSISRVAAGKIAVLTASYDYRSGRAFEQTAYIDSLENYPIRRIRLLRPLEPSPMRSRRPRLVEAGRDVVQFALIFARVARLVREYRVSGIIIGDLIYGGWIGVAARRLLGVPYIIYLHGEELTVQGSGLALKLRRACLRRAAGLVAVSRFTRALLIDRYGVDADRVKLIANGVDTERFRPQARAALLFNEYGLKGKRVLITVGRLVARKGIDQMIRALPAILDVVSNTQYLVVGSGPLRGELEHLAAQLGVRDQVTFCGEIPECELAAHYGLAELFVMPNRQMPDGDTEGFGLVFLEAGACGLPVIAGRDGGTSDAVVDGFNGLLVDGNSVESIATAVLRLLLNPELAATLRANGMASSAEWSWEHRWRMLSAFLARTTGSSSASGHNQARQSP